MIRFEQVAKRYATGHDGLASVSFHMARGEMAFLTGPSGAGKSTLLRLIGLIERHTRGQVVVGGQNLQRIQGRRVAYYRRNLGIIFQDHRLLLDRTVFDNVALPLVVAGHRRGDIERRVRAALDQVSLLGKERLFPMTLSGGEQQRVGIARAVVNKPPLLLADEPTGNLDPELSQEIMSLFERFNQVGVTVLIATHDVDLIRRIGRREIRLRDGRLAPGGGP